MHLRSDIFSVQARFLTQGASPYERATYRYSPLLAALLAPNVLLHPVWGKLLFVAADLAVGVILAKLLARSRSAGGSGASLWLALWLFNPLTLTVSTRGNADALVTLCVLGVLLLLAQRKDHWAAVLYGFAVHFKIYPIVHAPAFLLFLHAHYPDLEPSPLRKVGVNSAMFRFALLSASTFFALLGACYYAYGYKFLFETYFYHLVRKDPRHNFSVYFYSMYLDASPAVSGSSELASRLAGFGSFFPQVLLLVSAAVRYAKDDLAFCLFLQTMAFVVLNKVT